MKINPNSNAFRVAVFVCLFLGVAVCAVACRLALAAVMVVLK